MTYVQSWYQRSHLNPLSILLEEVVNLHTTEQIVVMPGHQQETAAVFVAEEDMMDWLLELTNVDLADLQMPLFQYFQVVDISQIYHPF